MSFEVGPPRVETRGLYFGSQACISASLLVPTPRAEEEKLELAPFFQSFLYDEAPLTPDLQAFLLRNYRDNVHVLYPIFDDEELSLDTCADNLETAQTYSRQFRLNMICSTSCYCVPGRRQTQSFLLPLARVFHRKAMSDVDDATSDISVPALRNFAVMALNSLFAPDQGNFSQLVGLASRMCADLGILRSDDRSLRRLFFAILCIERQVALTFDRPRFVPEPVSSDNDGLHFSLSFPNITKAKEMALTFFPLERGNFTRKRARGTFIVSLFHPMLSPAGIECGYRRVESSRRKVAYNGARNPGTGTPNSQSRFHVTRNGAPCGGTTQQP